jgi:proliferating cell nuclear antigen
MDSRLVLVSQIKVFTSIIQHLVVFSEYIRISLTPTDWLVSAVNDSHTSLCDIKLNKEWFAEYIADTTITLVIHTSILYKILHVLDDNEPITLVFTTNEIVVKGKSVQSDIVYTIPSQVIDIPVIEVPDDIEYAADINIPSKTFCSILDHLMIIGEDCKLNVKEDSMNFTSQGDYGSTHIDITIDEMDSYVVEENIELNLEFHLKLLHIVSQFHKLSEVLEMHVSNEKPLVLQYNINSTSYIRFMIAPKIVD